MRHASFLFFLCISIASHAGEVLPADVGLEGGKYGHWGAKNDANWVDGRWNETDTGPFICYALNAPGGIVTKGISIKLGERNEASICYDAASMTPRAAWSGKFITFDAARYGLINWPKPDGTLISNMPFAPAWDSTKVKYRGLHVNSKHVILEYDVNDIRVRELPGVETKAGIVAISRTLQIAPHAGALSCAAAEMPNGKGEVFQIHGLNFAALTDGDNLTTTCAYGTGAALKAENSRVMLAISGQGTPAQVKVVMCSGKQADAARMTALLENGTLPEDFDALLKPGPGRWGKPIATTGTVSPDKAPYVVDTISVPYSNPFKALMFLSGLDFFENGDAAVCSLHGDVWIIRGLDDKLDRVTWQRFATGLFQPMGLKIVNNKVHVMGRDRLTILHDLNGDGEADFYENFNSMCKTSPSGHDYSACLENDSAGNFYHVDPFGLHRISKDGSSYETLATGWRNPVSMSVGPGDVVTVSPQEGEWTPASQICQVKVGGFYGYGGPQKTLERPLGYDLPLCYVPRQTDNSTGGQVWVDSTRWGPLNGQLLNLSFGQSSMQLVLRETVDGHPQGGVVPLPIRFQSGAFRGRFRAQDEQLYVVGTMGWSSTAAHDGSFQRVRYTGGKVVLPVGLNAHANGMRITFNEPLQRDEAQDSENYSIEQWNYRYGAQYGSSDYSIASPNTIGHDALAIKSVKLLPDGRSLFIELPALQPAMQMRIKYNLKSAAGDKVRGAIENSIHKLGKLFEPD
jgi:hypothetical protein